MRGEDVGEQIRIEQTGGAPIVRAADAGAVELARGPGSARRGGRMVRHSRDHALNPEQLEAYLLRGPAPDDVKDQVVSRATALCGLRADEAGHLHRAWFNFQQQRITIPSRFPCTIGRGGKPCTECKKDEGFFLVKSAAGARTVPYKDLSGCREVFHGYFTVYEKLGLHRKTVWERTVKMAERAGIVSDVFTHALRATAAVQFADLGLNEHELCAVMGWEDIRIARSYIRQTGRHVEDAIRRGVTDGRAWL